MEDTNKTYEELEALKKEIDEATENLKKATKTSFAALVMRGVVAACTSNLISKATDAFLPKQLKAPVKAAVAFGTFFIPEFIGEQMGEVAEKIMEE